MRLFSIGGNKITRKRETGPMRVKFNYTNSQVSIFLYYVMENLKTASFRKILFNYYHIYRGMVLGIYAIFLVALGPRF